MINLRPYQQQIFDGVFDSWQSGCRNVCAVAPTGAGKTVIMSSIIQHCNVPTIAIAHRQELVSQISIALARNGIYHKIIATGETIKFIVSRHIAETGRNYMNSSSHVAVAGVDTLIRRDPKKFTHVRYWHIDEGHHVLTSNKWGRAVSMFPNARGVGWTATPIRADRKSLHGDHGGVYSDLVKGPCMRELIDQGYLSDYRVYGPAASIDTEGIAISSATGDFNSTQLRKAAHMSTITGDVVEHYQQLVPDKRAIVFAVDVQSASEIASKFDHCNIRAECVSAKTPDRIRQEILNRFRDGKVKVLCNVDLFGEGFDVPAVEVVIMARPTESYGLYTQQFGRVLRTAPGKTHGIIIDHVNNVKKHGLPDAPIPWALTEPDIRNIRKRETPLRTCVNPDCLRAWEGYSRKCPFCGTQPEPEKRLDLEKIEGDLTEYDDKLLERLRAKAMQIIDEPILPTHLNNIARAGAKKRWEIRSEAQKNLRDAMAWWAGIYNEPQSEKYRRFWHKFGVDVLTAQTYSARQADELCGKIWSEIKHRKITHG